MKSNLAMTVLACWLWTCIASAGELTFLQPDGRPASGVKFYRSFLGGHGAEEEMMRGGYGEMYDMMGAETGMNDMGMGMDVGMGMEGGMEMGAMQARPPRGQPQEDLAFLNGAPLQPMTGGFGELLTAGETGKVQLGANQGGRSRRLTSHPYAGLAVHESGFSFIPAGTKFSQTIKLRHGGAINVSVDEGIDASKYQVLTCWQNGFAYPSLAEYLEQFDFSKAGFDEEPKVKIDRDDWRFKPYFRWFQTASIGETISVPPGEVRVTIIPKQVNGRSLEEMNADELFELLIGGGPSIIQLFNGATQKTVFNQFNHLKSLVCTLPEITGNELPQWGDQPRSQYRLKSLEPSMAGDESGLVDPPASAFSSRVAFTEFLNSQRISRSYFQGFRIPTTSDNNQVRFELLRSGWYQIEKRNDDGSSTVGIPIVNWVNNNGESIAVLANGRIAGVDGAFELAFSDEGKTATFRSNRTSEKLLQIDDRQKSDAEKLKLVKSLRKEVDQAIARMTEHRNRLQSIEAELLGTEVSADPFAGAGGDVVDPFGGMGDPFGSGRQDLGADPFGN